MDIVIIADFCGSFDGKGNNRFIYLTNMLKKNHDVELVTSDFDHNTKKYFPSVPTGDGYTITMLHEGKYTRNVCIKRFLSHYKWGQNVKKYLKNRKKPDVIFCAIPPLTAARNAAKYCQKNKVKFVVDVQDLWPEAFKMVFNIPVISDILFTPFTIIANGVYKRANEVVAVSQTYVNRVLKVNSKCTKGHSVFLGTNLSFFDENVRKFGIKDRKPENELWLGYCGTLGASYDLSSVFKALRIINQKGYVPPKFVIMGSGPRMEEFKQMSQNLNVEFTGNLSYPEMCGKLAACDFVINPIMHNAAQSIINKHADYAAVGLPVINTQESFEYKTLVNDFNMGINVSNTDCEELASAIITLVNDRDLRLRMGKNARKCAEVKFDRSVSYNEIVNTIVG